MNHKNYINLNRSGVGDISEGMYSVLSEMLSDFYQLGSLKAIQKYRIYLKQLYENIATLLCCDPSEIVYVKNTTEGIHIASEVIPIIEGDKILVLESEYGANLLPWLKKKKEGFDVKFIKGDCNQERFKSLISEIDSNTKVVCISYVQYFDGFQADLKELSQKCKEFNVYLVVDAIQIVGTRSIDLSQIHVDILICGGQKYLNSLLGIGFMYVNKSRLPFLKDHCLGMRSVEYYNINGYVVKKSSERFEDGTPNLLGIVSLNYSIDKINKTGIQNIEKMNLVLLEEYKKILSNSGLNFIDYQLQGNIIALKIKYPEKIRIGLAKELIYAKLLNEYLRISFSHLNTIKDLQILISAIKKYDRNSIEY